MNTRKIKQFVDRHARSVWFACLLNVCVLAGMLLLLRPTFETNDDISIAMIVNGAWGSYDAHVVFQNYLLGLFYKLLYTLTGAGIPWYTVIQFTAVYASMTTVTYVIFQKMKTGQALLISGIIWTFFGYEGYIMMQFTKTSGFLLAAGAFLLFFEMDKEKSGKAGVIWGLFLGLLGSFYRFEQAAVCCVILSGIGLYQIVTAGKWKEQKKKKLLRFFGIFGLLVALILGGELLDRKIYGSDERWSNYVAYNNYRSDLMDYSRASYKDNEEAYKELGVNKTAYQIFSKGCNFYDPDVFSLETLQKMAEMRPKRQLNRQLVIDFLREYPSGYLSIPCFFGFIILAFLWLFWKKKGRLEWMIALYEVAVMGAVDFLLYYMGRYLENRVEVGLWFAISLVVIWLYDRDRMKISEKQAFLAIGCLFIASQSTWKERWKVFTVQEELDRAYQRESFLEAVSIDSQGLYLAKIGTISYTAYSMFDAVPKGIFENVIWYGGWEIANPLWEDKMAEYGVTNPYRDVVNQEHVYLVDNHIELTEKYICQYYQKKAKAKLMKEAGYLQVYQIKSKEDIRGE